MQVTEIQAEAASEVLMRRAARQSLLEFCKYTFSGYSIGDHHRILADALERIEQGTLKRLIVSMPPRHGKSEMASVRFPCWYMGRNPQKNIVQTGYSQDISLVHSRKARDVFASEQMHRLFPGVMHEPGKDSQRTISVQKQAAHEWGSNHGGRYIAVGVGGGLTGRGCDLAIIDDPVKNREDAESHTIRAKVWDWFRSTLYTRLTPEGAIIVVMTRWHKADLAGLLVEEMTSGGEQWEVISMPAIDDQGQALWPDQWPVERLNQIQKAVGSYEWTCLYQQEPTIRGGNIFKVDRIRVHDSLEGWPDTRHVRVWDLASSSKQRTGDDPDYTWGTLGTVTTERDPATGAMIKHLWIRDCVYCREEAPERNRLIVKTAERDGNSVQIRIESHGAYKDALKELQAILKGIRVVSGVRMPGDKLVKASPLEPIFEAGNVHVYRGPWLDLWTRQHSEFTGKDGVSHDDAVDCSALLLNEFSGKGGGLLI